MRAALLTILTTLSISTAAHAERGKIGLGVETTLNLAAPLGGILFVYDAQQWRVDGLFQMAVIESALSLQVGGRFHYVVSTNDRADFSVGGGAFIRAASRGNQTFGGNTAVAGEIDALAQIRVFLVESVALQGALGLGIIFGEGGVAVGIGGQVTGSFGLVYFF